MCISRAIMHSTYFSILVLVTSLKSCSSFLVPSSGPRQATGLPRHMFRSEVLPFPRTRGQETARKATNEGDDDGVDYSADPITAFLGKFLPSGKEESTTPQAEDLVFNVGDAAKRRGMDAKEMAAALDAGLRLNGWFVTGRVDASLFSDSFFFSDPQVSLTGVDKYAEGVAKLFNQEESRCDVISTAADGEDVVVRWRLSGRINLPFNPPIKPYVVTTTFERDSEGLLSTQRDEFAIAGWDILLHAVFPGHPFGAEPAPPVESTHS